MVDMLFIIMLQDLFLGTGNQDNPLLVIYMMAYLIFYQLCFHYDELLS